MAFDLKNLSILIVEDTVPMCQLLTDVLQSIGVGSIYTANDGEKGFEQFKQYNPDVVIADWAMAPVNGTELTKEIRTNMMSPNRTAPVLMISGYSSESRVSEAREAGVTEFLVKPFSANDLAKRLAYMINKPRDFVDAPNYFGPDRRRRTTKDFAGPFRRESDPNNTAKA